MTQSLPGECHDSNICGGKMGFTSALECEQIYIHMGHMPCLLWGTANLGKCIFVTCARQSSSDVQVYSDYQFFHV